VLEIGGVPTAALELETGGREHLLEAGLPARGADGQRRVAPLLEEFLLVAAARAAVLVERHRRRIDPENHILTQALAPLCPAQSEDLQPSSRRRFANHPPAASAEAMLQKTGDIPNVAPSPPKARGSTVW